MFLFLFDTTGFPARWDCGPVWREEPWLGVVHIVADLVTACAYVAIPLLLLVVLRRVKHAPAPRLLVLFAVFILACGAVHLIEALIFWWPIYRFSALMKVVTAAASVATVVVAAMNWPKLLLYRSPAVLQSEVELRTLEVEDTNERLALALAAGSMGTWDWDLDSGRVRFDATQSDLTGMTGAPDPDTDDTLILASDFFDLVVPEDRAALERAVELAINEGEPYNHEFRIVTPQGNRKWISGRGRLILEGGRPRRFVGVNFDVTRQKEFEDELGQARAEAEAANQAKSRFLANTSHEIRTPLTAILGCAEALVRDAQDTSTVETAGLIRRQGRLLERLLSDVLDLSKIEAGRQTVHRKGVCDVRGMMEDVRSLIQPLAAEKDLELRIDPDSVPLPYLQTDPIRLRQVLVNLVSNAVKYTDEGSISLLFSERHDEGRDDEALFSVIDTGVGIPLDQQEAVFEAFHQAQDAGHADDASHSINAGVGLGLAIAARLARLLGGEVSLQSEPGKGSTFRVHLPLVVPPHDKIEAYRLKQSKTSAPSTGSGVPLRSGKILVAEDTPSIQFLLRRVLKSHANEIHFVEDGQAAIDAIDAARDAGEPFDLLVLDMNMPVLSGYDAAKRLRRAGETMPIIALTASAMVGDRERCLKAGCSAYVSKPIDWTALESEVQSALAAGPLD